MLKRVGKVAQSEVALAGALVDAAAGVEIPPPTFDVAAAVESVLDLVRVTVMVIVMVVVV